MPQTRGPSTEAEASDLATGLREKPQETVSAILERYGALLRYVVGQFSHRRVDQEDLFQDVALKFLEVGAQRLSKWDPQRSAFSSYLYLVFWRTCQNCLAKIERERRWESPQQLQNPGAEEDFPQTSSDASEDGPRTRVALQEAVDRLEDCFEALLAGGAAEKRDRLLVGMRATGYTAKEICRLLGLSEDAVHQRYSRLRKRLRECLGKHGYESMKNIVSGFFSP